MDQHKTSVSPLLQSQDSHAARPVILHVEGRYGCHGWANRILLICVILWIIAVFSMPKLFGNQVGGAEPDPPDVLRQPVGVFAHDLHGICAVVLRCALRAAVPTPCWCKNTMISRITF